jgi:hypothetical protein
MTMNQLLKKFSLTKNFIFYLLVNWLTQPIKMKFQILLFFAVICFAYAGAPCSSNSGTNPSQGKKLSCGTNYPVWMKQDLENKPFNVLLCSKICKIPSKCGTTPFYHQMFSFNDRHMTAKDSQTYKDYIDGKFKNYKELTCTALYEALMKDGYRSYAFALKKLMRTQAYECPYASAFGADEVTVLEEFMTLE